VHSIEQEINQLEKDMLLIKSIYHHSTDSRVTSAKTTDIRQEENTRV